MALHHEQRHDAQGGGHARRDHRPAFRNKRASAFGSYGWTGGAVDRSRPIDGCRLLTSASPQGQVAAGWLGAGRMPRAWPPARPSVGVAPAGRTRPITTTQTTVTPVPAMPAVEPQAAAAAAEWDDDQAMLCTVCQWVYDPAQGEPDQLVAPGTPGPRCRTVSAPAAASARGI